MSDPNTWPPEVSRDFAPPCPVRISPAQASWMRNPSCQLNGQIGANHVPSTAAPRGGGLALMRIVTPSRQSASSAGTASSALPPTRSVLLTIRQLPAQNVIMAGRVRRVGNRVSSAGRLRQTDARGCPPGRRRAPECPTAAACDYRRRAAATASRSAHRARSRRAAPAAPAWSCPRRRRPDVRTGRARRNAGRAAPLPATP